MINKEQTLMTILKQPEKDWGKAKRTPWKFWPSSASCVNNEGDVIGSCIRRCVYDWMPEVHITNPVDDFVKTLGKIGCFLEERTRQELRNKHIYDENFHEKKSRKFICDLRNGDSLSAEIDIVIKKGTEHVGMEVKSYSNSTYKVEPKPKDPHLLQTFLYSYFFKPALDYFIIYYRPSMISKYAESDLYHRIESIKINKDVYPVINGKIDKTITLRGIIKRYKETKNYIINKNMPNREFMKASVACKQCPYKNHCWEK